MRVIERAAPRFRVKLAEPPLACATTCERVSSMLLAGKLARNELLEIEAPGSWPQSNVLKSVLRAIVGLCLAAEPRQNGYRAGGAIADADGGIPRERRLLHYDEPDTRCSGRASLRNNSQAKRTS